MSNSKKSSNKEISCPFVQRCRALGLDPRRTSLHELLCAEAGKNPDATPFVEVAGKHILEDPV